MGEGEKHMQGWTQTACALIVASSIGACGGSGETSTSADSATTRTTTEPPTPALVIKVPEPDQGDTIRQPTVAVVGRVVDGPKDLRDVDVEINGAKVPVNISGTFTRTLNLGTDTGRHVIRVTAEAKGFMDAGVKGSIVRELSDAEKAQIAAQQEVEFRAQATTIEYDELNKDPFRYMGDKVTYYGKIFQVQESFGGVMLLSVTDEGYGFWTDEIYVTYDGHIQSNEDDNVTIFGTVEGAKTYNTVGGGARTLPKVNMEYIDE